MPIILIQLLLLIFAVTFITRLMYFRNKNQRKTNLECDNNSCSEVTRGQERCVETDAVQLRSVMLAEPDQDEKVHVPVQVSERKRSPQIYKPCSSIEA